MGKKFKIQNSKFKILKKIGKYSVLLAIKEAYLFSRNLLGLIVHPFKTLRVILREQDYSQLVLILSLPFYILVVGLIFIVGLRFLIHAPTKWGFLAKICLFLVFSLSFLIFSYLGCWLIKIKNLKNRK